MPPISAKTKRTAFSKSGNRCAFPGCDITLVTSDGFVLGEIAHIAAASSSGARFDPSLTQDEVSSPDNILILCANHHRLVDLQPEIFSTAWLRDAKTRHEMQVPASISTTQGAAVPSIPQASALTLQQSLATWRDNKTNGDEEFWQRLFRDHPHLLAQAVPNHIIQFGQKCYIGGKGIGNTGGNVVDFLYVVKSTSNLVVVEIKTPRTQLLGSPYRANAVSISEDLSGALVQTLNYRDQATKNYHQLAGDSESTFNAFNPTCLVLAGDVSSECDTRGRRRSLDLFRSSLSGVTVIGFDELFSKIETLVDLMS